MGVNKKYPHSSMMPLQLHEIPNRRVLDAQYLGANHHYLYRDGRQYEKNFLM